MSVSALFLGSADHSSGCSLPFTYPFWFGWAKDEVKPWFSSQFLYKNWNACIHTSVAFLYRMGVKILSITVSQNGTIWRPRIRIFYGLTSPGNLSKFPELVTFHWTQYKGSLFAWFSCLKGKKKKRKEVQMKVKNRACEFNATFPGIISLLKGSKEGRKK